MIFIYFFFSFFFVENLKIDIAKTVSFIIIGMRPNATFKFETSFHIEIMLWFSVTNLRSFNLCNISSNDFLKRCFKFNYNLHIIYTLNFTNLSSLLNIFNVLRTDPTKWSNTLKQFVGKNQQII